MARTDRHSMSGAPLDDLLSCVRQPKFARIAFQSSNAWGRQRLPISRNLSVSQAIGSGIEPEFKYWAFLSYSHSDKRWGAWLHRALERYRVPKRLVGATTKTGIVPRRIYPIFRDREELPASSNISGNIREALQQSRFLIVICSPHSARSCWVDAEIKFFKTLGREDRILALIVDGEPNASGGKPGFLATEECFPDALCRRLDGNGELTAERMEPNAADARPIGDGRFNAKLKLLSGLLALDFDALKLREQRRRIRQLQLIAFASLCLIVILTALGTAFYRQRNRAVAARKAADELIGFMRYDLSTTLGKLGYLEMMDAINARIRNYHEDHPPEPGDYAALREKGSALVQQGDLSLAEGRLADALGQYSTSLIIMQELLAHEPRNADYQLVLSITHGKIGDAQRAHGHLNDAIENYRARIAIAQKLIQEDPSNALWQRNLAVSYQKMGDIQRARRNFLEALNCQREAALIFEKLAFQKPDDTGLQNDLAACHSFIGIILEEQGSIADALTEYQAYRNLMLLLTEKDKNNAAWERNLSSSYQQVGDAQLALGETAEALRNYRASLAIRKNLAKQDPTNSSWQSDLAVTYRKMGDLLSEQGDLPGAHESYHASYAIREKLALKDPSNAAWQRDLAVILAKIGDLINLEGDSSEALKRFRESVTLLEGLVERHPDNAGWQRDLFLSHRKTGDVLLHHDRFPEALKSYRGGLAIINKLASQDPGNATWQHDLSVGYRAIGLVLHKQHDFNGAVQNYRRSLSILEEHGGDRPEWQGELAWVYWNAGMALAEAEPASTEALAMVKRGRDLLRELSERKTLTKLQRQWASAIEADLLAWGKAR